MPVVKAGARIELRNCCRCPGTEAYHVVPWGRELEWAICDHHQSGLVAAQLVAERWIEYLKAAVRGRYLAWTGLDNLIVIGAHGMSKLSSG